jgi:predicted signal transduction protein with EAL and GGDEF domain
VLRRSDVIVRLNNDETSGMDRKFIARLGGDEFAAILPDIATSVHAVSAAEKIIKAMEEPFYIEGHKLLGGMSTGIALFPLHATNHNDLMIKADVAMYHAKKNKQGFAIYEDQFNTNSLRQLTLDRDMHNAIKQEQFILYYQPKINFDTGQVCGAEALIRWRHPELGMIPPDEFISIAEKSGLIRQVSEWVINQALQDCSRWRSKGHDVGVSVNISAINLNDKDLSKNIQASLVKWSVHPGYLILELTESSIMSNPTYALTVLKNLNAMGIGLSIDDFGTGHSSLAYIKKLPVTEIKIDKSFVNQMSENNSEEAIIRSIVILARYLNISLVVEGVEDKASYDRLNKIGCEIAQGYFIAKPMPVDDFFNWMVHRKV